MTYSSGIAIVATERAHRLLAATLLLLAAHGVQAASVFKCVDTRGAVAFQALPCAAPAVQTALNVSEQPLIDPNAPAYSYDAGIKQSKSRARTLARGGTRAVANRSRKTKQPVSYECRAADGEVFYRHSRCPGSIPGDGIARFGVTPSDTNARRGARRSGGGAWAAVPVTSRKISRDQACRAINATTAAGRDGSRRDERVSVYEHNVGRDPCRGF